MNGPSFVAAMPMFTVDQIRRAFDQAGIQLSDPAVDYLVTVANEIGGSAGLFHCTRLVCHAEKLVRENESLKPGDVAHICVQELDFVERRITATEVSDGS